MKRNMFLIFSLLLCFSVFSQRRVWISDDYRTCLMKSLPNTCKQSVKYIMIEYKDGFVDLHGYLPEPFTFRVDTNLKENIFNLNSESLTLEGKMNDNAICLNGKKYIQLGACYEKDKNILARINGGIFYEKYHLILDSLFDSKVLYLSSPNLSNQNNLYTVRECDKMFIVEQEADSIYLYKYLNACEGKSIGFKVKKELVKVFIR